MGEDVRPASVGTGARTGKRRTSVRFGIVIIVVVIVVVGFGGFVGIQSIRPSKSTNTTCAPASRCAANGGTNDVTMFIPSTIDYGQPYAAVAVGTPLAATVGISGGESVQSFSVTWAPGHTTTDSSGLVSYNYTAPGLFAVFPTALASGGSVHTGTGQMLALKVNPSARSVMSGFYPTVSLTLTNTSGGPFPWIGAGGSVTVNGSYASTPVDALYSTLAPTLIAPAGATQSGLVSGANFVTAKYTFANPGYFAITMVAPVTDSSRTLYQNYTWGVYVGATAAGLACPECTTQDATSPHPSTLVYYSLAAGGALTLDPAADYYSVGYEVDQSVAESLVFFNGTDTGQTPNNFVPEAATCVPGSPQCAALYGGNTLVKGNNFTFAIDPAAHFYDPFTGKARTVYPSDVMFSIIRAIMYTQVETVTGYYVGYDIAGPLIPYAGLSPTEANINWDLGPGGVGLHYPYNNTPYWTLSAFAVNDTAYCPAAAMAANGCITLHAGADGKSWPALLQILSIISTDGIQEAGWYTSEGASVPGFVCSSTNVDLPCLLPGGVTSTNTTAYKNWVTTSKAASSGADSPYGWDPEITAGTTGYPNPVPNVGFSEVGSGPYYLAYANPGVGYVLKANPAYQPPTGCKGHPGCLPNVGGYVPNVVTYWDSSDTRGITETEAGYADVVSVESPHFPLMLNLTQNGQLQVSNFPTLVTDNFGFELHIDLAALATYDTNPINIPANAFSFEGLRAMLEYAYPYQTAQAVGNVIDGIDAGNPYGGFLPSSESAFYNAHVPWPNFNTTTQTFSNPRNSSATTPGTAAWYWAQANNCPSGPLCDPELASFSPSNPLDIPILGYTTAPNINAMESAWGDSVKNITGGTVVFQEILAPEEGCFWAYYCDPWTIWWFGWIPDYPAPQNNWQGAYGTGLWGGADNLYQTLSDDVYGGEFNDTAVCGHYNPTVANMTYWADQPNQVIPQVCQGTALNVTTYFVSHATYTSNTTLAAQYWDLVQAVYNNLQLTIGITQANTVFSYAPWINPATINTNVMIGGGAEWAWYQVGGNGLP